MGILVKEQLFIEKRWIMNHNAGSIEKEVVNGEFVRQGDHFRDWVMADSSSEYVAEPDRYHLYVSLACPWAHRTIIARKLKGLESVIGMTVVDPIRDERGWKFFEDIDDICGFKFLRDAYEATETDYDARVTVPALWDRVRKRIVNNSEVDIVRMFNSSFDEWASDTIDFYPDNQRPEMDRLENYVYEKINNGVYRAGFAKTQATYESAVFNLFEALDTVDKHLSNQRFLCGETITAVDWNLFVTLVRFDCVYYNHFKCNQRRIMDYSHLWGYLRELFQYPGIAETVDFSQIKQHYFTTQTHINPHGIIPVGPQDIDFSISHGRELLPNS